MADSDRNPSETETIMMALDQISQTIEVMNSVVGRLRNYIHQQEVQQQKAATAEKGQDLAAEMRTDRILH